MIRIDRLKLKAAIRERFKTLLRLSTHLAEKEINEGLALRTLENIISQGLIKSTSLNTLAEVLGKSFDYFLPSNNVPWSLATEEWDPSWRPPGALLRAEFEIVPFHFRADEMADLLKWCTGREGNHVMLKLFTGAGGMGKTRLALELCRRLHAQGWRAGFLNYDAFKADEKRWDEHLQESVPLLLVLDYVEHHSEELGWLLPRILTRTPDRIQIRILTLARSAGDWWHVLLRKKDVGDALSGGASFTHALTPLAPTREERASSYRTAYEAFSKALASPRISHSTPDLRNEYYSRVLLLHMSALAAAEGTTATDENGILDYVLQRERRFWAEGLRARDLEQTLNEGVNQAVAVATLCQGVESPDDGLFILEQLTFFRGHRRSDLEALNHLLNDCYPGNKWIEPLQPDLLGQRLCELTLTDERLKKEIYNLIRELAKQKRRNA